MVPHFWYIAVQVDAVLSRVDEISPPKHANRCWFLTGRQSQSGMYTKSLRGAIRAIQSETGVFGFYQGFSSQLIRDLPLYGVMLGSYEAMRCDTKVTKKLNPKP